MPSYVIVWENNTPGHSRVPGRSWPGHSSVHIGDGFWDKPSSMAAMNYVSFWPKEDADFSLKGIVKAKPQAADLNMTVMDDVDSEQGYLPDHIIRLPSGEEAENKMKAEFANIIRSNNGKPEYKMLRQNCSTVVSRVLHAGGFYAEKWAINNNVVWTPSDVQRLAASIPGGQNVKWTDFVAMIKRETGDDNPFGTNTLARSGCYCTTGAPVEFQSGERFTGADGEFKGPSANSAYRPQSP